MSCVGVGLRWRWLGWCGASAPTRRLGANKGYSLRVTYFTSKNYTLLSKTKFRVGAGASYFYVVSLSYGVGTIYIAR
jgi:hypothetical protein